MLIHPNTIVGHLSQLDAALFDHHDDILRPSIKGVFKKLLDHRFGAMDNFTCRNLIGNMFRKNFYSTQIHVITELAFEQCVDKGFRIKRLQVAKPLPNPDEPNWDLQVSTDCQHDTSLCSAVKLREDEASNAN